MLARMSPPMADWNGRSLASRLALVTAIWSACALLVTGVILTELFRRNAERTFDFRIETDLLNLVRDASGTPSTAPALPDDALGSLFLAPFSGWAWQIRRGETEFTIWMDDPEHRLLERLAEDTEYETWLVPIPDTEGGER
jgi:hypothetical protein